MDLKIGRRYKATLEGYDTPHTIQVVSNPQILAAGSADDSRVAVRDLSGGLLAHNNKDLELGGDVVFIYNVHKWSFQEVPMSEFFEELLKELISHVGEGNFEEMWNRRDLREFLLMEQGRFMVAGFLFGKGYTTEEINASFPNEESMVNSIDNFNFDEV